MVALNPVQSAVLTVLQSSPAGLVVADIHTAQIALRQLSDREIPEQVETLNALEELRKLGFVRKVVSSDTVTWNSL